MSRSPNVAFAMDPARTEHVLTPGSLDRLAGLCTIIDAKPLQAWDDERARVVLSQTEILVTGWGCAPITPEVLAAAANLRLIAHAAGTVKGLVPHEVFDAGIIVTHAADANAVPVAEFTLAAILFANKKAFRFRDLYCADRNRTRTYPLSCEPIGNYRRTIGIIGASKIGRRVIALLKPFDLHVLLHDPFVGSQDAAALGVEPMPLDELMARSDVVSLHAPALPSTRGMIDRRRLALMPDGSTFINTARGIIVNEADLIEELRTGRIDAIIDVTHPEVPEPGSALYDLPNVFLTPHMAGAIGTERTRLGEYIVDEIERYVGGRPLHSAITPEAWERMA